MSNGMTRTTARLLDTRIRERGGTSGLSSVVRSTGSDKIDQRVCQQGNPAKHPQLGLSLAKWYACDRAWESANDALEIHGAYGYSNEYPVERYLRNARALVIYEGTREIHQLLQAEYALGYRRDKPVRRPLPPYESEA
jgi:alkylation response protein AidB-like acyl-CoA dehydrogenase